MQRRGHMQQAGQPAEECYTHPNPRRATNNEIQAAPELPALLEFLHARVFPRHAWRGGPSCVMSIGPWAAAGRVFQRLLAERGHAEPKAVQNQLVIT